MKKLLLTAAGFLNPKISEAFLGLVGKPPGKIKLVFIPTASRTKRELRYVARSKKELLDLGVNEQNIKTLSLDSEVSYGEVAGFDVMYVCGGNTFYLLHRIRETGFDDIIRKFVEAGKVYVGVSAGSILLGPSIGSADTADKNDIGIKDATGLGLVDFVVFPHYCKKERQTFEKLKKKMPYQIIALTDNQALEILENKTELIE